MWWAGCSRHAVPAQPALACARRRLRRRDAAGRARALATKQRGRRGPGACAGGVRSQSKAPARAAWEQWRADWEQSASAHAAPGLRRAEWAKRHRPWFHVRKNASQKSVTSLTTGSRNIPAWESLSIEKLSLSLNLCRQTRASLTRQQMYGSRMINNRGGNPTLGKPPSSVLHFFQHPVQYVVICIAFQQKFY